MHEIVSKTIDKISFKINIPILISIIVWVAIVLAWYFSLMNDMNMVKLGIVQIIEKQWQDIELHKLIDSRIKMIEDKVLIIETKEGIK